MEINHVADLKCAIVQKKGTSKSGKPYEFYCLVVSNEFYTVEIPIDNRTVYGAQLGVIARLLT